MNALINGWESIKLKDLCREITVGFVGPMATEYTESGIPFLRSQNILPFRLELSSIKFISPEFHKKLKKSALHPGDVVVVRTGYPGTACVIPSKLPVSNCADLVIFRPSSQLDPYYLGFIFNSTLGRSHVAGNLVGVAQQHFNVSVAKEMVVNIPPLPIQRKITSILSAYDDLIENNTRRIAILEEMAQSLYREWFVHFRFPGHEKKRLVESELGLIPEGWEVVKLGDTIELAYGKALTADARVAGDIPVYGSAGIVGYHNERLIKGPGIIVGRKGNVGSVFWSDTDFFPIDTVFYVRPKVSLHYIYYNLKAQHFINNDAAVPGLNRNQAYLLPFLLPTGETLAHFQDFVSPLFDQIKKLTRKNANLRQTRDLLLPKLISGEVDVEELEIHIQGGTYASKSNKFPEVSSGNETICYSNLSAHV
jgi:type I restriction enzyme, S subunit